ncbi:MAG: pyridoxal-phosphate dependent enzyme [Kofleriaceae bacterium]|nr:pyridoxal-phosphate dependent enzyme [Myxococcales bacterium]MCB9560101.1 pyridoxal-phosphate dependent enzyme [Kofleriaceae bacterium]MCB9571846.1 pyridoxal-phosphate dependent enzyme [Kofleriaceae bacterium]
MTRPALETEIVDRDVHDRTVALFRERGIVLPTLSQLADPDTIPAATITALDGVDPDAPDPANLFRVHWHNRADRKGRVGVPDHVVLPKALTGVDAPILVAFGNRFPMIRAHKVLAAYGCLVPRLVTGQFDPTRHRAVWPSTGNYCRGGVAISRILGCRGVAVLPEGMSEERFRWLEHWAAEPGDIVRTVGTESNVKEIYDKCAELDADPGNVIFNQFSEFANHLVHLHVTGPALDRVFEAVRAARPGLKLAGFVSATGSAGTIAAGDHLKDRHGTRIVAAEALECPTMLYNGFGEHNIQGIGDKHIPFIHNVTNTDVVSAVSDVATDSLNVVFNTAVGREVLAARGVPAEIVTALADFGLSSICNVLSAIKTARLLGLGPDDAIVTVATDGAEMYATEIDKAIAKRFGGAYDRAAAERALDTHLAGASTEHTVALSPRDRDRIFNLGYFTWVEQQGVSLDAFERRRDQAFWVGLRHAIPVWDELIRGFNAETGVSPAS